MDKSFRIDLILSYWIFLWFILYVCKITKYSPKFPLIIGIAENILLLVSMIAYGTSSGVIFYFAVFVVFAKILPFYYLINEPIKMVDIYVALTLFLLFNIWLHINNRTFLGNINAIRNSIIYEKNDTPFMAFIYWMRNCTANRN